MKNKILKMLVLGIFSLSLVACGKSEEKVADNADIKKITVKTYNGENKEVDVEVPVNPKKVAVLDLAALDILDNLGVGDNVVGVSKTNIDYLAKYSNNKNIKNLGTIKEADMEAVMSVEPDIIFIGGRLSKKYDELSKIAPVVYLKVDSNIGVVESVSKNSKIIASIFGLDEKVNSMLSDFNSRINKLKEFANNSNAIVGMTTSGSFNILGDDGRCSIIGKEIAFNNVGLEAPKSNEGEGKNNTTSTHGNEASFEYVVTKEPEYIFVMDRDAAINTQGAKLAKEIVENDLIKATQAYKNNRIIYLEHPSVWYTAEGGITALDIMLKDLESSLLK